MNFIIKLISKISELLKYSSAITLLILSIFITISVILRAFNNPITGDYVIVQLLMVILVMTGLPYTQQIKGHVSIDIIVSRFSNNIQIIFDIVAHIFTILVGFTIGSVNILTAIDRYNDSREVDLIHIPIYPFVLI